MWAYIELSDVEITDEWKDIFCVMSLLCYSKWSANLKKVKSMGCFVFAVSTQRECFCLHSSSASDKCLYNSIWSLSSPFAGLARWSCEWKRVWLAEHSDHLNCSIKEHFNVMIRPRLPTTTKTTTDPHPLQCSPQCGWLETGSAVLCISSVNRTLSILQWRTLTEDGLVANYVTCCYWASVVKGFMFTEASKSLESQHYYHVGECLYIVFYCIVQEMLKIREHLCPKCLCVLSKM